MTLTEKVQEFEKISAHITRHQNTKTIGYFLIPFIIGVAIVFHARKQIATLTDKKKGLIRELENNVLISFQQLVKECQKIIGSKAYLVYLDKFNFLNECDSFQRNIVILTSDKELFSQEVQDLFVLSQQTIAQYKTYIATYNENFVKDRMIEYDELFRKSPYPLDSNQKNAIIVDDKHNLVIAGAGSGKTETLITRIAYLISRKPDTIRPERILALAFQKKAALEMSHRLQERFGFDVKIKTFHALGKEILDSSSHNPPQLMFNGENFESQYRQYISKIFNEMKSTPEFQKDILNYLVYFGDNFQIKEEMDFSKKEEYFRYMQNLSYTALNGIKVKSEAERTILNYLLTHTINQKRNSRYL